VGKVKVAFLSTYPPRECGIATFTQDLLRELNKTKTVEAGVVALSDGEYDYGREVLFEIRQQDRRDYAAAAEKINGLDLDLLVVEHEYGIYGSEWGSFLLDLVEGVKLPVVVTLHTTLSAPNQLQRDILQKICQKSEATVVMAQNTVPLLSDVYSVDREKIVVIHHGVPRMNLPSREELKREAGLEGRTVVSTFGLLSPGKGIEYGIRAIGQVAEKHRDILYLILGQTHPVIKRQYGEEYREQLEELVDELGLKNHVQFVNRYLSKADIMRYLKLSDIYLTPYLGKEQAVSGTLAYAVGCGRVIVSTPYAYAEEMLADGRGLLAEFKDSDSIAKQIQFLLDNPQERKKMEEKTQRLGEEMFWDSVAKRYAELFQSVKERYSQDGEIKSA
jgi:glycosyltransferase involved in cell wall biosynthesis